MLTIIFNSDFNAIHNAEIIEGTPIEKPIRVSGRSGQALKTGPSTGYVEYPTQGVISPAGGTIEMWICPEDWRPGDKEFHVFFEAKGEGTLLLYKYWETDCLYMLTSDDSTTWQRNRYSIIDIGDWKPGEWHHIAGTWSAFGVMCYVDGKPASDKPTEGWLPKALSGYFRIGDHPWSIPGKPPRTSMSLIDEVRIYDRPLSPAHIAAHKEGNFDFEIPLTGKGASLKYDFYPDLGEVQVRLSTGSADVDDARLGARLAIVSRGEAIPMNAAKFPFIQSQVVRSISFVSPEPGEHDVVAEVLLDNSHAFELRSALTIPTMEWKDSQLGREDIVLPPWTPLEVRRTIGGCQIKCWGREYSFIRSALPTQIISQDKTMLSRPISLLISSCGQKVAWTKQSIGVLTRSETRAELTGTLIGKVGNKTIRFKTCITSEYDGLLLINLTCETPKSLELVDSMAISIPLSTNRALYLHRWVNDSWAGYSGRVPEEMGVIDHKTEFVPYAWLGDNDRGLFWFCESDQYWPNSENEDAIQISNSSGDVEIRLNLLAEGQRLLPNWRFTFGLQATPVKRLDKDWLRCKWRLEGAEKVEAANIQIIWTVGLEIPPKSHTYFLKHYGYPEAMDSGTFRGLVSYLHERQKVKVVPYLCLVGISAGCPEWPYFRKWAIGPDFSAYSDVAAFGESFKVISPLAPGWSDFIIWKNKQFIDQYGLDGVYHDLTEPWGFTAGGCGYERDGIVRPTYPILAFRDLYRRMYAVIKSMPGDTFTIAHESGKAAIPILTYDDAHLDGENFHNLVKDNYMDVVSLDAFRAEFMGRQWGPMPLFLPEFGEDASQIEPTRGLMALLLIHDVFPWANYCCIEVLNDAWKILDKFGYINANFIPYFDPQPPATFNPQPLSLMDLHDVHRVNVSAYQRADKTMLIVANIDKVLRTGKLRINFQRLNLKESGSLIVGINWPGEQGEQILELDGDGLLSLEIPGQDYRMIVVSMK